MNYYTMVEAAEYKGVSYHTVSRAVRRDKIPHGRIGRHVLIARTDLDNWNPMVTRRPSQYWDDDKFKPNTSVEPSIVGAIKATLWD